MKSKDRVAKGYVEGTDEWQDRYNMLLEDEFTCTDCKHLERCCSMFGQSSYINSGRCQFFPNRFVAKTKATNVAKELQMKNLTCFKCWENTAKITYEENRLYKIACTCGHEYTFNHCGMYDAVYYHNKMLELYGKIEQNRQLRELIKCFDDDCTTFCGICINYRKCKKHKVNPSDFFILKFCKHFKWRHADKLKAQGIENERGLL